MIQVVRWLRFLFLLCPLLALQSCASRSVTLVHLQSGSTVRCGASGIGILVVGVEGFMGECEKKYADKGYVPLERLTPEQRADLEKRGLLPTD